MLIPAAMVVFSSDALAQSAPSITISAQANKVGVGEMIGVSVEVKTENEKPEKVVLPSFEGFDLVSKSISSPLQFSFGYGQGVKMTYSTRYDLHLQAIKEGTHRIGPVIVKLGGKEYKSDTIVLQVTKEPQGLGSGKKPKDPFGDPFKNFDDLWKRHFDRPTPTPPEPQPPETVEPTGPPPEGLEGANYDPYVFIRTVVKPQKVYMGQQATLDFFLYSRVSVANIEVITEPAGGKFWTKEMLPPTGKVDFSNTDIGGISFQVATLRKVAIFPTEAGIQEIAPGEVSVSTGFGGIFGGKKYNRKGVPVTVEVIPLPTEGRPDGFDPANVGKYTISAKLGAKNAVVDQPLPVQIIISGTGNIEMVVPPEVEFPEGVKSYDPQVTDNVEKRHFVIGGRKKIEYIIIPTKPGKLVIPPVKFSFFDPVAEKYETVQSKALPIEVEPSSFTQGGPVVEGGGIYDGPQEDEEKGIEGLRPIITVASLRSPSSQLIRSSWFIGAIAFPPALLCLLLVISLVQFSIHRMKRRSPKAVAHSQAKKMLKESVKLKDKAGYYARIQKAIYQYIEMRFDIPAGGMTNAELRKDLDEIGVGSGDVEDLIQELENCEFARYGRSSDVDEDIKGAAGRVQEILDRIEKSVANHRNGKKKNGKNDKGNSSPNGSSKKKKSGAKGSGLASIIVLAAVGLALSVSAPAAAENVRGIFDRANDLYFKGDYRGAIKDYYRIMNLGIEDTSVYFNTANAFSKLGEYGKAIYFYNKVLKVKPRDTATTKNLGIVRSALGRKISKQQRDIHLRPKEKVWEGAVSWFSPNELVIIFLFFYYMFFIFLAVRKYSGKPVARIGVSIAVFFFLLMWFVSGAMVTLKYNVDFLRKEGIVTGSGLVVIREGPTDEAARAFDVAEGARIKVKESRGRWHRIEDERGKIGWLPKDQLGIL